MKATAFADLTAAVKALLMQAPAVAGGLVSRGRLRPLQPGQACSVLILPAVAQRQPGMTSGPGQWLTTVVLELQARAAPAQDPEDALDALLAAVFTRLQQLPQAAPGVADAMGDPRIEWELMEADTSVAVARLAIGVQHRTAALSLAASA